MNYLDVVAQEIGNRSGMDFSEYEQRRLLRIYAVLARAKGVDVTAEDVHDAWAAWRLGNNPGHPSLVPFGDLEVDVQEFDLPYAAAIRAVAKGLAQ